MYLYDLWRTSMSEVNLNRYKCAKKTLSETSMQGAPGFALFPQLAPGLQMHRPRQGCTSLGSTEGLLCSGSWSPDALIETLRPCRNQREGKGEQGRGCKHIWHLQNPADSHNIMREMYRPYRRESTVYPLLSHMQRKICTPTQLCAYYLYNLEK